MAADGELAAAFRPGARSSTIETWQYEWDADNRLVPAVVPDGTMWRYAYDAFGRRVAKTHLNASGGVLELPLGKAMTSSSDQRESPVVVRNNGGGLIRSAAW